MAVSSSRGTSPLSVWLMLLGCAEMDVLVAGAGCEAGAVGGRLSGPVVAAPMAGACSGEVGEFGVVKGSGADVGAASMSWACKAC